MKGRVNSMRATYAAASGNGDEGAEEVHEEVAVAFQTRSLTQGLAAAEETENNGGEGGAWDDASGTIGLSLSPFP